MKCVVGRGGGARSLKGGAQGGRDPQGFGRGGEITGGGNPLDTGITAAKEIVLFS